MSLEAKIEALTDALTKNTEAQLAAIESRGAAIAAAQAVTNKAPKTDAKTPAKETKSAAAAADGVPTQEDVNASIVAYMAPAKRPEEREARKAKIVAIVKKTNAEGKGGGDVPEGKRAAFIKALTDLLAKGDLTEPATVDDDLTGGAGDDDLLGED